MPPKMAPVAPKVPPRPPQEAPKCDQGGPKEAKNVTKGTKMTPKVSPRWPQWGEKCHQKAPNDPKGAKSANKMPQAAQKIKKVSPKTGKKQNRIKDATRHETHGQKTLRLDFPHFAQMNFNFRNYAKGGFSEAGRGGISTPPLAKEELGKGRKERLGGMMDSVKPPIAQGLVGFCIAHVQFEFV